MYYFSKAEPNGYLYCPRFDKVEHGDVLPCIECPHFEGTGQGEGRECRIGDEDEEVVITDPYEYLDRKNAAKE